MRPVHIRVGHDDDAVVAQLLQVEVLADARAQGRDQRGDLGRGNDLVDARPFHVEDLPLQGQDRLELPVAPLLGGAARRIALDEVELAQRRIALLAIRQLAGQADPVEHALAPRELTRLAGGFARARSLHDLGADDLRVGRPFHQEISQLLAHDLLDHGLHLRGHELVLGLGRELRLRNLHRQHAGQSFPHVVAGGFHLRLLGDLLFLDVAVDGAGHRRAQSGEVGAAVALRNVVGEHLHGLAIAVVPLHRDLDRHAVLLAHRVEDVVVQHGLGAVHVLHKPLHPAGMREILAAARTLVDQLDLATVIEEGKLAQALGEDVVVEFDLPEDLVRGEEMHFGAAAVRLPRGLQRLHCHAAMKLHEIRVAVAPDPQLEPFGKRIHHRDTDPVQAARDLVRVLVELPAGVQLRHDDLGRRSLEIVIILDVGRNAAPVVDHGNGIVRVDDDLDVVAVPRQRLVDRVVHDLEHHVVQPGAVGRVPDVHAGALAHRIESLEDLDAVGVVFGRRAAVGMGQFWKRCH